MSLSKKIIDLKCSICLHYFHDPIILNCGHTFDRACIQEMIDSNKPFIPTRPMKCPLCSYTFDSGQSLVTNKSLANIIIYKPTFEWFLIDISSDQQRKNVLTFLKHVFDKREIYETNHITFETNDTRIAFNSNIDFDQQLQIKSLSNLNNILQETCDYLQEQNGLRKICILTDGLTKHLNVTKISSEIINQRFIIHIGDKNTICTRQLADEINFDFGHFNEKTLDIYVKHFITNF